jgi:signal transduction histidine kinase/CheY-like chemotaxis protein
MTGNKAAPEKQKSIETLTQEARVRVLSGVLLLVLVTSILVTIGNALVYGLAWLVDVTPLITIGMIPLTLLLLRRVRRGQTRLPGLVLVSLMGVVNFWWQCLNAGQSVGISSDPSASYYSFCIVLAAVLLGSRAAVVTTLASMAAIGLAFLAEYTGYIVVPAHAALGYTVGFYDLVVILVMLGLTGLLLRHLTRVLWWALGEARETNRQLAQRTAELARANEQLRDLDRLKDDLINQASHDLRTPLTAIRALVQLVKEKPTLAEAEKRLLTMALGEVDRLTRLLNDLLDLRRLGAGAVMLHLQAVDLPAVIAGVLAGVQAAAAEKSLTLRADLPADPSGTAAASLPWVEADPDRLLQVLTNLLSNAVKYTPPGGAVVVRAAPVGAEVHIAVQDTGVGIPPEEQGRIFEPFHRASAVTSATIGAGLGLAICQQIVARHGGRIWVESAVGQGSTFTFSLPRSLLLPPAAHPAPAVRGRRVLVVDDDAAIQKVFAEALHQAGYEVLIAAEGETALHLAREARPDVILLDLLLPGPRGEEVLVALRQDPATARIPVVVCSIIQEPGDGLWPLISDYLAKPVDLRRLVASVRRAVGGKILGRVLVVDDDPAAQLALSEALTAVGFRVTLAADGAAGLAAARLDPPDAILLDVALGPGPDGWEVLRQLQVGGLGRIPVIVLSGVVGNDARTHALQLGAVGFYRKPLDLAAVQESVRQLVAACAAT